MAGEQSRRAEIQVVCIDSSCELADWDRQQLAASGSQRIVVLTKADLQRRARMDRPAILTSSVTGQGLAELRTGVAAAIAAQAHDRSPMVAATASRCRASLVSAAASLRGAKQLVSDGGGEELIAAQLREALHEIGQVVGAVYTDDILDRIFSRFCIGK
jgi:tRNA modification GTPase